MAGEPGFIRGWRKHSPSRRNLDICIKTLKVGNSTSGKLSLGKITEPKYLTIEKMNQLRCVYRTQR